jgi:hypothetical protein
MEHDDSVSLQLEGFVECGESHDDFITVHADTNQPPAVVGKQKVIFTGSIVARPNGLESIGTRIAPSLRAFGNDETQTSRRACPGGINPPARSFFPNALSKTQPSGIAQLQSPDKQLPTVHEF